MIEFHPTQLHNGWIVFYPSEYQPDKLRRTEFCSFLLPESKCKWTAHLCTSVDSKHSRRSASFIHYYFVSAGFYLNCFRVEQYMLIAIDCVAIGIIHFQIDLRSAGRPRLEGFHLSVSGINFANIREWRSIFLGSGHRRFFRWQKLLFFITGYWMVVERV